MKLLVLSMACLCGMLAFSRAQSNNFLFNRFFGNRNPCSPNRCAVNARCQPVGQNYRCTCNAGFTGNAYVRCFVPTTTTTTTTTTKQTTQASTRNPSDADLCKGRMRIWSECVGNPPTRFTTDGCVSRSQVCTDGVLLGNLFRKTIVGPIVEGAAPEGARTLGGGAGARTFRPQGTSPNVTGCVVQNVVNAKGEVITGRCVRNVAASSSNTRRSKRSSIQTKRDLLIMLDESYSVGRHRFEKVKRIAAAIVKLLCDNIRVNPEYTRVAVITFNRQVAFYIRLQSFRRYRFLDLDADRLAAYIIRRIYFRGGRNAQRTCLINALEYAYNTALDSRYGGRRGDPRVEQDIIIISDGCENCVSSYRRAQLIQETTSFFIQNGIHVYVIGIGLTSQCKDSLSLLAQGGRCFHFFYLTRWDLDVDDFIFQLENPPAGICLNAFENQSGQCLAQF